ncbi:General secretion pathway protein D [uncultured Gammaproteobacteria bacterium]|uniref:type II secretion system secretin GspD n=1 Tax=Bathymodiolus heckerae thiotrophic gill symbiont TaxID=1052212 RepID=UPI0010B6735F|nr:type II secretion system secretin GspD [Bathymodiolus heckerae thiotrophic gill symbiont]CAC9444134.1 General secretion pathway protein D [uncultured Gammaproteobacteria bacterium]SMN13713.1 General secretion pathway protein D [Bathymodiolus heckerae thiotrophic gill symbiont]SMN15786.1 General secretion pathway protein D [uncultured Candidatus Thioglobus sp.]
MRQQIKIILLWLLLLLASSSQALMLNLKNTDIRTLINTVSQATGKNFIIDPRVKAKVNVVSNQDVSDERLYHFFASILQVHGYVIIPGDDFDKILPKNATKNTSPTKLSDDLIVSAVLAVKNVAAKELIAILRPLVSQYGYLAAYSPSNSIVMTDTTASIKRIKDMIVILDKQVNEDYEIITLEHTSAQEIANIVKSLLAKKSGNALVIGVNTQTNQIIVGGNKNKRLKARFLISELDKQQGESGDTSIIYLKHADAKNILPVLQGIAKQTNNKVQKNKVSINIQADEATNAIVITAPVAITLNIKKIINKLDVERVQVLIEAVIAEISSSNTNELGIQWLAKGGKGIGLIDFNGQIPALLRSASSAAIKSGATFFAGSVKKDSSGKVANALGLVINALNSLGNANILSTPSIVTLDNEEAEIVVGNEVPFITNTQLSSDNSNPFQNYERKNVGLTLKVKPQVNGGNGVKLKIEQEVSNVLPSSTAVDLITSKRNIKTTVMVENNKILVLGGMIDTVTHETQKKVPLLGDIPFLGGLFRYNIKTKEKRHLLVFIRPTILNKHNVNDISQQKYSYFQAEKILESIQVDEFESLLPSYSSASQKKIQPTIQPTIQSKIQPKIQPEVQVSKPDEYDFYEYFDE